METTAPRDYLVRPSEFGKSLHVEWRGGFPLSLLATAEVQHRYACAVRGAVKQRYGSVQAYCEATGQSYQRLGRILRGTTKMQVDDIGIAVEHLNISVAFLGAGIGPRETDPIVVAGHSAARDSLGAFYTPADISRYLLDQLDPAPDSTVLEPAFGDGSFLQACLAHHVERRRIYGCEIDPSACEHSIAAGYIAAENVYRGDFFDLPVRRMADIVVGNPPFVRLRTLDKGEKDRLVSYCETVLGTRVGEEASEWLPFLLKSVAHILPGGSLAFVLPFDFTYLRYALPAWRFLGDGFSDIRVVRVKERLFTDVLQEVVLLIAKGRGGRTDRVRYDCYETVAALVEGERTVGGLVAIDDIVGRKRPFQRAMVSPAVLQAIESSGLVAPARDEARFHIGYVCGNKAFFHPDSDAIDSYGLQSDHLVPTVVSSRQLAGLGYSTAGAEAPGLLWLPEGDLSEGECRYVAYGESQGVDKGYKCSRRNPWWKVPGVSRPDAILTVFGDTPRMVLNDGGWAVSNSLLGAYCRPDVAPGAFCSTWYSAITRLSMELQIHSLGGGVLIAVPQEAGDTVKLSAGFHTESAASAVARCLDAGELVEAYRAYDEVILDRFGTDFLTELERSVERLASWRRH